MSQESTASRRRSAARTAVGALVLALSTTGLVAVAGAAQAAVYIGPSTAKVKTSAGPNGCTVKLTARAGAFPGEPSNPAVLTRLSYSCPASSGVRVVQDGSAAIYELLPNGTQTVLVPPAGYGQGTALSGVTTSANPCSEIGLTGAGPHDLIVRTTLRTAVTDRAKDDTDKGVARVATLLRDVC